MLVAEALTKAYRGTTVVSDVSMQVAPGRIVGLVGANGAGKTTTLKMLSGLVEPSSGTATIDGQATTTSKARGRIGFLPEESPLYEELTPLAYLAFFARLYDLPAAASRDRAEELLRELQCDEQHWTKTIGTLSKGLKRKVAIARCLLHEPRVLILDEPTSGLDPFTMRELEQVLRDQRKGDTGILLSAHNLPQVEQLCDEILIMHAGRIVTRGTLAQLRGAHGASGYRVRATMPFPGSQARGPIHETRVPTLALAEAAMEHVKAGGGHVLEMEAEPPSLDEILRKAAEA